jgi:hypothetical protein
MWSTVRERAAVVLKSLLAGGDEFECHLPELVIELKGNDEGDEDGGEEGDEDE